MFEQASRLKLRFATSRGNVTADDLWDLPLTSTAGNPNLDDLAKMYHREMKTDDEESFVVTPASKDATIEIRFNIVKHIIDIKLAERETRKKAADVKARRQQILDLIVSKENEALGESSIDELRKLLLDTEEATA